MRKYKLSLPLPDITGVWVFSWASGFTLSGGWFTANPGWLFLAELIAIILVLSGAYRVLDAWIARVSREERALLEARQAAILAAEKEEKGDKSHVSQ